MSRQEPSLFGDIQRERIDQLTGRTLTPRPAAPVVQRDAERATRPLRQTLAGMIEELLRRCTPIHQAPGGGASGGIVGGMTSYEIYLAIKAVRPQTKEQSLTAPLLALREPLNTATVYDTGHVRKGSAGKDITIYDHISHRAGGHP